MNIYFYLILNTHTSETRYEHGMYDSKEDIIKQLQEYEKLIMIWRVVEEEIP